MILPYCLNIHPGETLPRIRGAITNYALKVKQRLAPASPYPLGLRFSAAAVEELSNSDTLELFKEFLEVNSLYATSINGFPFGAFHGTAVKSAVYQPDWSSVARVNYTIKLASILATLLPDGMTGNISTVPLGYKYDSRDDRESLFIRNISKVADSLRMLYEVTGKRISLAIEPEPDCVIENSIELLEWFNKFYNANDAAPEYIGVCLDTSHFAVQFEDQLEVIRKLEKAGIRIARVQLSAAISTTVSDESMNALKPFIDPVYLHQIKIRSAAGKIIALPDLNESTLTAALQHRGATLRAHFHIPLFFEGTEILQSTNSDLSSNFFAHIIQRDYFLEIETYTFDVLPPAIKPKSVVDSLVMEHAWVIRQTR